MTDRDYMENMLLLEKGACQTFATSLGAALRRQEQIYGKMEQKGWYSGEQVQQSKINEVKMKFAQQSC